MPKKTYNLGNGYIAVFKNFRYAAFVDSSPRITGEINRILKRTKQKIEDGNETGKLMDVNGNCVGFYGKRKYL